MIPSIFEPLLQRLNPVIVQSVIAPEILIAVSVITTKRQDRSDLSRERILFIIEILSDGPQ